MNDYEISDDPRPAMIKKQLDPFKLDVDFIEVDEESYYAMADDIADNVR